MEKILIVFHSEHRALALSQHLEKSGMEVDTVYSLQEAEVKYRSGEYTLYLIDVYFPFSSAKLVLTEEETPEIFKGRPFPVFNFVKRIDKPVILLDSYPTMLVNQKLASLGLPNVSYVYTPPRVEKLISIIQAKCV